MGALDRFLNRIDTAGGVPILERSNPLDWTRLSQTVFVSVVATFTLAQQTIIQATSDAYASIITGVTEFVTGTEPSGDLFSSTLVREESTFEGLFGVVTTETTTIITAVWSNAFTGLPGVFRLPAQVAVLLVSFWIAAQAIEFIQEEVI